MNGGAVADLPVDERSENAAFNAALSDRDPLDAGRGALRQGKSDADIENVALAAVTGEILGLGLGPVVAAVADEPARLAGHASSTRATFLVIAGQAERVAAAIAGDGAVSPDRDRSLLGREVDQETLDIRGLRAGPPFARFVDGHGGPRSRADQMSLLIATAVSDMRFEKPHSLSYHERMRTKLPSMTLVWSMWNTDEWLSWLKSIETFEESV